MLRALGHNQTIYITYIYSYRGLVLALPVVTWFDHLYYTRPRRPHCVLTRVRQHEDFGTI